MLKLYNPNNHEVRLHLGNNYVVVYPWSSFPGAKTMTPLECPDAHYTIELSADKAVAFTQLGQLRAASNFKRDVRRDVVDSPEEDMVSSDAGPTPAQIEHERNMKTRAAKPQDEDEEEEDEDTDDEDEEEEEKPKPKPKSKPKSPSKKKSSAKRKSTGGKKKS